MLEVQKEALANRTRQRLVALREKELDYYTANCRMLGNQSVLVAGFAYSAIRYHNWMEQQEGWYLSETETVLEVIFVTLLTATMCVGVQVCLFSTMLSIFGPLHALRGGDGAIHAAVHGMQQWTRAVLALFMFSLFLLQLGALSMLYGHQLGGLDRLVVIAVMVFMVVVNGVYARKVLRTFALPPGEQWVSGSYFIDTDRHGKVGAPQSSMFADGGLSRRRGRCLATRLAEDETAPLTAESLDAAITEVDVYTHAVDDSKASSSLLDGRMASTGQPRHGAPHQRSRRLSVWQQWAAVWAGLAPVAAATGAGATCRLRNAAAGIAGGHRAPPFFSLVGVHRLLLGSSRPSYRRERRSWLGRR